MHPFTLLRVQLGIDCLEVVPLARLEGLVEALVGFIMAVAVFGHRGKADDAGGACLCEKVSNICRVLDSEPGF